MKTPSLLFFFTLFVFQLNAQQQSDHPLVGTWEMISIKGINADGEKFLFDTSTVREIKVITPSHYMLIAFDVEDDSLVFNRSYFGELKLVGNQYIELPIASSVQIFDNVKSNFLWKIANDQFVQSGTFTRPDGKTIILDEMVFRRIKTVKSYDDNPTLGTWEQLSSSFTLPDGQKGSHTSETKRRYQIITPTHCTLFATSEGKFEHAMIGRYRQEVGKMFPFIEYSSLPTNAFGDVELTQRLQGDKLYVNGKLTAGDRVSTWQEVFRKMK